MERKTLTELARQAGIPESTARYYAKKFPDFFHAKRQGKTKLYPPIVVDMLRLVAKSYDRNQSQQEIEEALSSLAPRVYEVEAIQQRNSATTQQAPDLAIAEALKTQAQSQAMLAEAILRLAKAQEMANEVLAVRLQILEQTLGLPAPAGCDLRQNDAGKESGAGEDHPGPVATSGKSSLWSSVKWPWKRQKGPQADD